MFTDTDHCRGHAHCKTCRERSARAAGWRVAMAQTFGGSDSWDCPEGLAMGAPVVEPPMPPVRHTSVAPAQALDSAEEARRHAVCVKCEFLAPDATCGLMAGCCGGRRISTLAYKCPRDKWGKT